MRSKLKLFLVLLPFSLILGVLLSYTATKVRTAIRSQFAMQVEFIQRTEADRLADSLKHFDQTCRFAAELDATTQFVAWNHQRPSSKDVVGLWKKQLQGLLSVLVRPDGETTSSVQEVAVLGLDGRP